MAEHTPMKIDGSNTSDGFMDADTMSRNGFSPNTSLTIFIVLITINILSIASYFFIRACSSQPRQPQELQGPTHHQPSKANNEVGLDEATLLNYPMLLYLQAKINKKDNTSSCCPICLADYRDTDMLRLLPDCSHLFHVKCVDTWLRLHPTCPICRMSPLPTPLAEVVPLASMV